MDPVENCQIAVGHDGEIQVLKEGEAYTRKKLQEQGWQIYEYRIQKKIFEEEGDYAVVLYSEDAAGNRMGNAAAKSEDRQALFEFSVDKSGPSVILSGAEDGGYYRTDALEVFLTIKDNMLLKKAEIYVGDKKELYEGERLIKEVEERDGMLAFTVEETDGWQQIEVRAEDAAGNQIGDSSEGEKGGPVQWRLFVNSNQLVHLLKDPGIFIFFLPVAFLGATAGILALRASRSDRERKGKCQ